MQTFRKHRAGLSAIAGLSCLASVHAKRAVSSVCNTKWAHTLNIIFIHYCTLIHDTTTTTYLIITNNRISIFCRICSTTSFCQQPFDTGKPLLLSNQISKENTCRGASDPEFLDPAGSRSLPDPEILDPARSALDPETLDPAGSGSHQIEYLGSLFKTTL